MAGQNPSGGRPQEYRYRVLRYVPNQISGEFYNVAVVVYDADGRVLDARFAPDFRRMRCNPAVEMDVLTGVRNEFEERRLLGEDFTGYLEELAASLGNAFDSGAMLSGHCSNLSAEIERLVETRLATPAGLNEGDETPERPAAGRRAVRMRTAEAFAMHGLFRNGHGVQRDKSVEYGASGLKFVFDFQYQKPLSEERFVHALGLRSAEVEAGRLCFVLQQYRDLKGGDAGLTVVADDALGNDVRDLLAGQGVGAVNVSVVDGYAESVRAELGL